MATSAHKHSIKSTAKAHKAEQPAAPRDPAELAAMVTVNGVPQFNAVSLDKRYVPARLPTGKVIEVWGDALMRTPEGDVHPLRAGDEVHKGDVILTAQNGIVQMEIDGSRSARLPFGSDLQGPLAQVNATDQFEAPGAGPGDPGSLSDGLRVNRINEGVTAQAFSFSGPEGGGSGLGEITPNGATLDAGNQRPVVDVQNIVVPESGVIIASGMQPAAVTGMPGFAVFTVHLNSPAVDPVTLGLKLTAGTATLGDPAQGGDFGSSGPFQGIQVSTDAGATWVSTDQVAVPAGATEALVRVPLNDDTLDEFNETFTLTAQSLPGSTQNVTVIANATILDNDPSPTASITNSTVNEGDGHATFTVTLSSVSGKPISVDWSTADDTAKAGQDYAAAAGTLTFAPGETSKTFTVDILNDKLVEPNETFFVNLSNGVNVNSDPVVTALPQAIATITDNDHAPVLVPLAPGAGNEDSTQTGSVLTGATDADGDSITVIDYTVGGTTVPVGTQTTLPGVGTLVINGDGGYTFTPAPNYNGPVPPVSFHATDGANVTPGTIQLTITPVNDPPVLVHQTPPPGLEDTTQTGNVLTGATDVENDKITVVDFSVGGVTAAAGGIIPLAGVGSVALKSDGSYVFTPVLNYAGPVPQITFRATDGTDIVGGNIQLAITPVNDAPVLVHQTPPPQLEDTTQTGNVLTGATDVENDPITVVDFTVGGVTAAAGGSVSVTGVGSFVVNSDGSYVFTPTLNYDGTVTPVPTITFRATDHPTTGLPAIVAGDIRLAITPVNDAPVVGLGAATVSELGLVGAQAATSHPTSTTGQIAVSDVDSTVLTAHLVAPTTTVTSGGQTVSWTGAGTVADPLHGSIDGQAIINATIDNAGNYKVDLLAPIDNRLVSTINFGVSVSDGLLTTLSTLAVNVQNDTPVFDIAPHTATASLVDTNLLIVLDTSSSMSLLGGISDLTRLQSAVQSIGALLDKYEQNGNVAVRLVAFNTDASEVGTTWLSVQGAKDALATIQAAGNTNYDAALTAAQAAFHTGGAISGAQNVTYFFSDGNPTEPAGSIGISSSEEASWTSFLSANSMRSVAIGLGPDPKATNLDPIAYDGAHNINTGANLVSSLDQLNGVLAGTIVAPLTGFLPGASAQTVGGADGGYISHVTINNIDYSFGTALQPLSTITPSASGSTFTYDANSHVLHVTTAKGGSFSVDMDDGSYGYTPPKGAAGPLTETIGFTVGDHDGDNLSSTLTINVSGATHASATIAPASVHATVTAQSANTSEATSTDTSTAASSGTTLHASPLSDVFSWTLADAGQPGAPGTTHVVGFDGQAASRGGDVLNLHDLLQGELAGAQGGVGNLGHYLDFGVVGSGAQATTTVQVSSHGGFSAGQATTAATDQVIVLDNLDIRGALGLDGHAANQQIIEAMLQQGKLVVDGSNA